MIFINYIQKFFHKKKKEKESQNSIIFSIDSTGKQVLEIVVGDIAQTSIINLANLLYNLNIGNYQKDILNTIITMANKNPDLAKSLELLLIEWAELSSAEDVATVKGEKEPYIRPTKVFSGSKD